MYLERRQQINKYKIKRKLDKYQNTLSNLLITGIFMWKYQNIPKTKIIFLYLF
jgi:hypothetical protein